MYQDKFMMMKANLNNKRFINVPTASQTEIRKRNRERNSK